MGTFGSTSMWSMGGQFSSFRMGGDALVAYLETRRIPLLDILDTDGELCEDDGHVYEPMTPGELAELAADIAARANA